VEIIESIMFTYYSLVIRLKLIILFLNLVVVSENHHVSYTGIRHSMDTNIFCGPGSSISGAVAVQIFQDFDHYSREAELLDNYKQIFEHCNKLFNMYHAVNWGAGSSISSRLCAADVGLLKEVQ